MRPAPATRRGGRFEPLSRRLDPDQLDLGVVEERREDPDRVGASADAGDHPLRQGALGGQRLLAGLFADHPLKVADQRQERGRPAAEPIT